MPHEVKSRLKLIERLYTCLGARREWVRCTFPHSGAESERAHGTHIAHHSELIRPTITSLTSSGEAVSFVTAQRHVVVFGIRLKTGEGHMVIEGGRGWVRDGRLRRSRSMEREGPIAEVHSRLGQLLVRVPRNRHPVGPSICQANLHWLGFLIAVISAIVGVNSGSQGQRGEREQHREGQRAERERDQVRPK
jgi:hypothetical protein